ncbi:OLC1v1000137C1 [Oldenlandia corymbosa var. corymbosa]|uniref:Lipase n=1 Tax=Oldenlandia corymbosa var. corymbosa TaxID=529605 RepID=A0AAV1D2I3_OLDCO|nr:OLC1v1000137C1 [Oldenlandia corymbosa var. corymbosa]
MELLVAVLLLSLLIPSSGGEKLSGLPSNFRLRNAPAAGLCAHLIEPAGYPCSEHITQTKDGYLLGLQRVSGSSSSSRTGYLNGQRGPPVLLLHGLMMSGDAWFMDSPNQSLGFILADNGFDVWAGNVRGTRWSHGHVSLSEREKEFWDWSWQELALYDLAEMARYISNVTNSKVFIVGHSQGTIMSLAALTQPDLASMVEAAALLCPISYLNHISTEFVLRLVKMHMDDVFLAMGIHELNFKSDMGTQLMDMICDGRVNCNDLLGSITGKNCCFNDSRIDFYLEYEPHPTSAKNLHHLFQMIRKGTFKMYDYGFWKNFKEYGSFQPPRFDLRNIPESIPLWMGYGGSDALADVTDVRRTLKELKGKPELLYLEEYGHIDFLLSVSSKKDVYDDMIRFFKNLSGRYTSY